MFIRNLSLCALFAVAVSLSSIAPAKAVVPSDTLMPASTRGYVSIGDINELDESWQQTQLGQLIQDESMRPFVEDMKRQLQHKFASVRKKLGLELGDLKNIAGGEIGLGFVERSEDRAAIVVAVDISGHASEADDLLKQVTRELGKRGARKKTSKFSGTSLTTFTIPPENEGDIQQTAVYFIKDNMLCATDNALEAEELLSRFSSDTGGRLADARPYQEIMGRCRHEAGQLRPELRWFVDPFGYARASRSLDRPDVKRRGTDYLKILSSQGFDAIQGIGGFVNLSVNSSFDLLHRTVVFAPNKTEQEKHRLAMQMMKFPNSLKLGPQPWIPRKLATYRAFNIDLQNAFDHFGSLFDEIIGMEKAFDGVIEGLERDPYGPQIDVRRDFIQHLGSRVTLVTDYELPITTKCERFMFIVEVTNEQVITETVKKLMDSDENAFHRVVFGHEVWEIQEAEEEIDELDIAIADLDLLVAEPDQQATEGDDLEGALASSAVCVANGHLYIASHIDFLTAVLDPAVRSNTLRDAGDFLEVEAALSKLVSGKASAKCFLRTDEAYRPTYELLRQGKMPEAETLLGRLLNRVLTSEEDEGEGILREQRIDGRKLPDFEMVRRYFGPAGTVVRSDDSGWFISGVTLCKQAPLAREGSNATVDSRIVR